MANTAGQHNITVNQYSTFKETIMLTTSGSVPLTIVSWSFTGSIRSSFESPTSSNIYFTMSVDSVPSAIVTFSLPPWETARLSQKKYFYDIIATNVSPNPDEIYRLLEGKVMVNQGITPHQP
jgi:hypothetical protein